MLCRGFRRSGTSAALLKSPLFCKGSKNSFSILGIFQLIRYRNEVLLLVVQTAYSFNVTRGNETTNSYPRWYRETCPLTAACSQKCGQEHVNRFIWLTVHGNILQFQVVMSVQPFLSSFSEIFKIILSMIAMTASQVSSKSIPAA